MSTNLIIPTLAEGYISGVQCPCLDAPPQFTLPPPPEPWHMSPKPSEFRFSSHELEEITEIFRSCGSVSALPTGLADDGVAVVSGNFGSGNFSGMVTNIRAPGTPVTSILARYLGSEWAKIIGVTGLLLIIFAAFTTCLILWVHRKCRLRVAKKGRSQSEHQILSPSSTASSSAALRTTEWLYNSMKPTALNKSALEQQCTTPARSDGTSTTLATASFSDAVTPMKSPTSMLAQESFAAVGVVCSNGIEQAAANITYHGRSCNSAQWRGCQSQRRPSCFVTNAAYNGSFQPLIEEPSFSNPESTNVNCRNQYCSVDNEATNCNSGEGEYGSKDNAENKRVETCNNDSGYSDNSNKTSTSSNIIAAKKDSWGSTKLKQLFRPDRSLNGPNNNNDNNNKHHSRNISKQGDNFSRTNSTVFRDTPTYEEISLVSLERQNAARQLTGYDCNRSCDGENPYPQIKSAINRCPRDMNRHHLGGSSTPKYQHCETCTSSRFENNFGQKLTQNYNEYGRIVTPRASSVLLSRRPYCINPRPTPERCAAHNLNSSDAVRPLVVPDENYIPNTDCGKCTLNASLARKFGSLPRRTLLNNGDFRNDTAPNDYLRHQTASPCFEKEPPSQPPWSDFHRRAFSQEPYYSPCSYAYNDNCGYTPSRLHSQNQPGPHNCCGCEHHPKIPSSVMLSRSPQRNSDLV